METAGDCLKLLEAARGWRLLETTGDSTTTNRGKLKIEETIEILGNMYFLEQVYLYTG